MNFVLRAGILAAFIAFSATSALALPNPPDIIQAEKGPIKITPIYHASMQIEYGNIVFQIDPFGAGDYTGAKKANYILITHPHPDHLDTNAIKKIVDKEPDMARAKIFCPQEAVKQLESIEAEFSDVLQVETIESNGEFVAGSFNEFEWELARVPAYNLVRGPKPGQKFHPKDQFNGYVLTLGGKRIYIAGDTEATPEMKSLKDIDIAFLPMNLPYTMTPQEAATAAKAFKPKVVYPYHYRYPFDKVNNNPQQFQKALEGSGIQVRLRNWYAHPAKK